MSREITHQFDEHRKRVLCIGWSVDDQDIMTSANDKRLNILNLSNLELKNQIKSPSGKPILHLKYGKKGEKITIIDECGKIYNLGVKNLAVLQKQEFAVDCASVKSMCISNHGAYVFVGFKKNILVYDRSTLEPVTIIKGFEFEVTDLKIYSNDNKVYVIDQSGLSYVSRIGQGASVIEDLNDWLNPTTIYSIESLTQSNVIQRLFTSDNFNLWLEKNPLLFPLLKYRSQFETEA